MNRSYYNRSRGMYCPCATQTEGPTCALPVEEPCGEMTLAMAYIPVQQFDAVYEVDTAFMQGTLFPALDKPLMVGGVACG